MRRIKGTYPPEYTMTPCGMCTNCRLNRAHEYGARIYHESLMHEFNTFVTLTYDDEHLPIGSKGLSTIDKNAIRKFMADVRARIYPDKVRFFGCAEYGSWKNTHRPHYHFALFGIGLYDSRLFSNHVPRDDGFVVQCPCWKNGDVHVGKLEIGSSNYVAEYTLKKVLGKNAQEYYTNLGIEREFARMSLKPGLGYDWLMKNKDDLLNHGFFIIQGRKQVLPRYYVEKLGYKETDKYFNDVLKFQEKLFNNFLSNTDAVENFQRYIKNRHEHYDQLKFNHDFMERIKKGRN